MPRTVPIDPKLREQIGDDIAVGFGRNDIARRHSVSPGLVSKIARERGLGFRNAWMAGDAVKARQIDLWAARAEREDELLNQYLALPTTTNRNGRPTREEQRLSYALYNVNRHHNGTYR
ncbi:hypothetical protein [Salinibacterium sp.]|uniref:hypothetical protein n=1 Tax=Salinibacterium sp. TaxID=1915057 RepID=UPI00286C03E9|nr:hypothetical protein [Salinibacterium sp.]